MSNCLKLTAQMPKEILGGPHSNHGRVWFLLFLPAMCGNYWNTCLILPVRIINYSKVKAETCHLYTSRGTPWWIWELSWDLTELQRHRALPLNLPLPGRTYKEKRPARAPCWEGLISLGQLGDPQSHLEHQDTLQLFVILPQRVCLMPDSPRSQAGGHDVKREPLFGRWSEKQQQGKGKWDEKGRQPRKGLLGSCGQMELNPARELWETGWKTSWSFPYQETRKLGYLSTNSHHQSFVKGSWGAGKGAWEELTC